MTRVRSLSGLLHRRGWLRPLNDARLETAAHGALHNTTLAEDQLTIGVDLRGQTVTVPFDDLAMPHVWIAGPSGSGRTSTLRLLIAQAARAQRTCFVASHHNQHAWAHGLPDVTVWPTLADIDHGIFDLAESTADTTHARLLFVDDVQHCVRDLNRHWQATTGSPVSSPGVQALKDLLWLGRAARIHVVVTGHGQRGPLGVDPSDFATLILLRGATRGTWRALAPQVVDPPPPTKTRGSAHLVARTGGATELRLPFLTDGESRLLAEQQLSSEATPGSGHFGAKDGHR